jgi:hypothetical protein
MPRSQKEILVAKKGKLVIDVTNEERRVFLQWVRDYSNSLELGRPGVRDAGYYRLRDKPWTFIEPDYETANPDGTIKKVLWSEWSKKTLIAARKRWIAGDRGPDAFDPDLLDDDGDAVVVTWYTDGTIREWKDGLPSLDLDPRGGQPKRVLVLCEKAGKRGIVENACQPTRTDYLCCRGDATLRQKQNAGEWAASVKKDELEPIVLYAGDHDMQGVNMDLTWVRDVAEIDSVTRVAITLDQARERDLPMENAYDKMHYGSNLSDAREGQNTKIRTYIGEHGPDMVELNALDEYDLRDLLRTAIGEHVDQSIWNTRKKEIAKPTARAYELIEEVGETLEQEFPGMWS